MAAALLHRGPDGGAFHFDGPVALAHRRLAIIDLSAAGLQPMTNEDGQVVILVNGEIYNYAELRADLVKRGHRLRSACDSEVVAHLYEEVGPRVPELLRGMFALAIYDARQRRLLLARDRFGEKPLYYALRPDGFAFASELAALLADPGCSAEPSPAALDLYLSLQYIPAPHTAFRHIRKLPAGCRLLVNCGGEPHVEPYYELRPAPAPARDDEAQLQVRAAVEEAVQARLMSDVPLGAFLSGGLDSSIVVACMARASRRPVQTFSVALAGAEIDELPFARQVAQRFHTDHHEMTVKPDMVSLLPSIVRHHGEPFGDSSALPTRYLCETTCRHVTVALSGDGGDEAFGGYTRYAWAHLGARLARLPAPLRWGARMLMAVGGRAHRYSVAQFGRDLSHDDARRYLGLVGHFNHDERAALYGPVLRDQLNRDAALGLFRDLLRGQSSPELLNRLCGLDARTYLPDDIFTKVDVASMTFGLEARAPFVDHPLMELALGLPAVWKLQGRRGKRVLARAFADLVPPNIRHRRKKGFALPLDAWFSGPLRTFVRDQLLDRQARQRGLLDPLAVEHLLQRHWAGEKHGERIWNLVVLEEWHRELVDGRAQLVASAEATARSLHELEMRG
jgi:asparagine synthase (glutamine-hydrolysing)